MATKPNLTVVISGTVLISLGTGFALGRLTAPQAAPSSGPPKQVAQNSGQPSKPTRTPINVPAQRRRRGGMPQSLWARAQRTQAGIRSSQDAKEQASVTLDSALQMARKLGNMPDSKEVEVAARNAALGLHQKLLTNNDQLAAAVKRFGQLTDGDEAEMLAAVLGQIRDPEIEQMAVEVANSSADPRVRAAAFDILDAHDSPLARKTALETLVNETDVNVRRAALRAIPEPLGASKEDAEAVVQRMNAVLRQDQDQESRRRAVIQLGTWHRSTTELQPVMSALLEDPNPAVRAGAAFSLEMSGRRDPSVLTALGQALQKKNEDPLVRENAYKALKMLGPLPGTVRQAFSDYEREIEQTGAGEGG